MLGDTLWWAAYHSGDPKLRTAADDMLRFALQGAERASDGTPYHQPESREIWSDGSFTTPPFLAVTGHYDEAIAQLHGVLQRLWDPEKKLMRHCWSESKWTWTDASCWGGGNGWTVASLMRVIRSMPPERRDDREALSATLKALLDGCLAHQRADGLFHNEVDNPKSFVETDLASMLAYTIYESVRGGWLPGSYLQAADRMRAAVRVKVDHDGFVHGVAGSPTFDKPGISTEGQAFFILMEATARKAGRGLPQDH